MFEVDKGCILPYRRRTKISDLLEVLVDGLALFWNSSLQLNAYSPATNIVSMVADDYDKTLIIICNAVPFHVAFSRPVQLDVFCFLFCSKRVLLICMRTRLCFHAASLRSKCVNALLFAMKWPRNYRFPATCTAVFAHRCFCFLFDPSTSLHPHCSRTVRNLLNNYFPVFILCDWIFIFSWGKNCVMVRYCRNRGRRK